LVLVLLLLLLLWLLLLLLVLLLLSVVVVSSLTHSLLGQPPQGNGRAQAHRAMAWLIEANE
jgi:hypothetical protein